jgi:serine/threonine protein phosphatase PrpC
MSHFFFEATGRSAVGLIRNGNEDSALISSHTVAVADGMGGHVGGEVASKIAINTLAEIAPIFSNSELDADSADDLFLNSAHTIDLALKSAIDDDPALLGMGTTLTSLFIRDSQISLLHIGDSRAYRLRGNSLDLLSVDHTVLQELLTNGAISPAEAHDHPQRSMLTQVLMGEAKIAPSLQMFEAKTHDRYLLCSDGLTGVLSDKEIKTLVKGKNREDAISALLDATYINGAPDNVTVIIADISDAATTTLEQIGAAQS